VASLLAENELLVHKVKKKRYIVELTTIQQGAATQAIFQEVIRRQQDLQTIEKEVKSITAAIDEVKALWLNSVGTADSDMLTCRCFHSRSKKCKC
jgi:hypothetical protein